MNENVICETNPIHMVDLGKNIQLLEYMIPTPAAAAAAAPAPPKSPLCYGVSRVMVLAMLWC